MRTVGWLGCLSGGKGGRGRRCGVCAEREMAVVLLMSFVSCEGYVTDREEVPLSTYGVWGLGDRTGSGLGILPFICIKKYMFVIRNEKRLDRALLKEKQK